jgi:hypothetical protein
LILPAVRSYIEKSCNRVAKGEISFKDVVDHVLNIFKKKFEHYEGKFSIVDDYIKKEFVDKYDQEMKKEKGKNPSAIKEDIGFPEEKKSYEHCSIFEDYKAEIVEKRAVLRCRNCNRGELKKIKPKSKLDTNIYLRCTQCKYEIVCFKDCQKFEILKASCEECDNALIRVNYPVKDSPFPMYANQHAGCLHCDDVFRTIVEFPEFSEVPEYIETSVQEAPLNEGGIVFKKKKGRKK